MANQSKEAGQAKESGVTLEDLKWTRFEFRYMTVYMVIQHLVIKFGRELILEAVKDVPVETVRPMKFYESRLKGGWELEE